MCYFEYSRVISQFHIHEVGPWSINAESISPDQILDFLRQLTESMKCALGFIVRVIDRVINLSCKELFDELEHFVLYLRVSDCCRTLVDLLVVVVTDRSITILIVILLWRARYEQHAVDEKFNCLVGVPGCWRAHILANNVVCL